MSLTLPPLDVQDPNDDSPIANIEDLTTGALDGTGVFDVLMATCTLHIEREYTKNRITGKDYATVYLGAMTAVLQAAVAFLTQDKEIEKLNAEIGLLRQKTVSELANTSDTIPAGLGFNDSTEVQGTVNKQNNLYAAQTKGFASDAIQKISKLFVDTLSV